MDKLKINLIPPEIKEKAKKEAKTALFTRISVGLLGILVLITSGIIGVIIFQSVTIQNLNSEIEREKTDLEKLKDKEAVVYFLKNRIDSINMFATTQHTQNELYELVDSLLPPGINLVLLKIDKSSKIALQGETTSSSSLDNLFNNLTDKAKNDGKIDSVSVESLSKIRTGTINFTLSLNLAKK